jgi:U8 snoRNA-decapping enzyme
MRIVNIIKNLLQVLGWVRVPLYTMQDGYKGLPAFLDHNFCGNSRDQLLIALEKTGILTPEEIQAALEAREGKN